MYCRHIVVIIGCLVFEFFSVISASGPEGDASIKFTYFPEFQISKKYQEFL